MLNTELRKYQESNNSPIWQLYEYIHTRVRVSQSTPSPCTPSSLVNVLFLSLHILIPLFHICCLKNIRVRVVKPNPIFLKQQMWNSRTRIWSERKMKQKQKQKRTHLLPIQQVLLWDLLVGSSCDCDHSCCLWTIMQTLRLAWLIIHLRNGRGGSWHTALPFLIWLTNPVNTSQHTHLLQEGHKL